MNFQVRFSKSAVRDVEAVLTYTLKRFGKRKHAEYKSLIREALKDIAADPLRFPAKHRPEQHPDARTFHVARKGRRATHFFLYRVSTRQCIDIGRLLHDAMDLGLHLPPGFDVNKP